jgi:hypothetical protein
MGRVLCEIIDQYIDPNKPIGDKPNNCQWVLSSGKCKISSDSKMPLFKCRHLVKKTNGDSAVVVKSNRS